jgi:hypothetical protein
LRSAGTVELEGHGLHLHVLATGYKLRSAGTAELEGHGLWSAGTVELEDEDRRATDGSVVWELKHEEKKRNSMDRI